MDIQEQTPFLNYTQHTMPPAQLWIGDHNNLIDKVILFLQKIFCVHHGCQTCTACMQIRDQRHHAIMWLHPDKNYTLDQLNDLFTTITFQLQKDEHFVFIIQKADLLTSACANKLLKSIEEPPAGYHFILLAENKENIVPTIVSRCILHTWSHHHNHIMSHPLFPYFTTHKISTAEFSKILDTCTINEQNSVELLDAILHYWTKQYTTNITTEKNQHRCNTIVLALKKAYKQLPMPGSAQIFWRNLYLYSNKFL